SLAAGAPAGATPSVGRRRPRTALRAGAAVALLAAGGAAAALLLDRGGDDRGATADGAADAAPPPADAAPALATPPPMWPRADQAGPAVDAVLALHPADSVGIVSVSLERLRASELVTEALESPGAARALEQLRLLDALCGFDILASVDTVTLGGPEPPPGVDQVSVDLTVRGRFSRDRFEGCLRELLPEGDQRADARRQGRITRVTADGTTVWLAWRDEHTGLAPTREDVDRAWLEARLRGEGGAREAEELVALIDQVDTGAALWAVAAPPRPGEALLPGTEPPRSVYASLRLTDRFAVHAGLRYDTAA